jgi:hypothetical protein
MAKKLQNLNHVLIFQLLLIFTNLQPYNLPLLIPDKQANAIWESNFTHVKNKMKQQITK